MIRARKGRMIFISSVVGLLGSAGRRTTRPARRAWSASPAPVARELGSRNITANVVAPGSSPPT
jgi:3-oxoacyl-[acyl-carrier protein] reductase